MIRIENPASHAFGDLADISANDQADLQEPFRGDWYFDYPTYDPDKCFGYRDSARCQPP